MGQELTVETEEPKRGRGRLPGQGTLYKPEYVQRALELCIAGAKDVDLCAEFNVTMPTITNWRLRYPEFRAACRVGKDAADDRVERSLYEIATGYTYETEQINKDGDVVTISVTVPPSFPAQRLWLSARRKAEWAVADRHEVTGANGTPLDLGARELVMRMIHEVAQRQEPAAIEHQPAALDAVRAALDK